MKYLRSLMQQSVTACKNQAKLIQQFTLSLLYLSSNPQVIPNGSFKGLKSA